MVCPLIPPTSWPSLWSSRYNRSELAADLYDEILFQGKTLGDIQESGGPFVVINATDIELGSRFAFDQRQFDLGQLEQVPFVNSLKSAASVPLNSYNFETLSLIRDLMITWDEDIIVGRCWDLARRGMDQTGCYDMDHVLIEVSFNQIADEVQRERFKRLPTGFRLPVESVDELRQAAADILERSADFKKILRDQVKGPARSVPDR